jgi:hypothetical protein
MNVSRINNKYRCLREPETLTALVTLLLTQTGREDAAVDPWLEHIGWCSSRYVAAQLRHNHGDGCRAC